VGLLLLIISTTSKVIQWDYIDRDVSFCFLFQSYLSCVILYAGLYIDMQAVSEGDTSPFDPTNRNVASRVRSYSAVVFEFFHFTLATQTAVGLTGNMEPRTAPAYLLIIIQMGNSFIFHTYIFGLGLLKIRTNRMQSTRQKNQFFQALRKTLNIYPVVGPSTSLYGSTESLLHTQGKRSFFGDVACQKRILNEPRLSRSDGSHAVSFKNLICSGSSKSEAESSTRELPI